MRLLICTDELRALAERLYEGVQLFERPEVAEPLQALEDAAKQVARAWSGSSLGYQSCVYYADLEAPPPGARFSSEWGFEGTVVPERTRGDWREYSYEDVLKEVDRLAGDPDLDPAQAAYNQAKGVFKELKPEILSILATVDHPDEYLDSILERVKELEVLTARDIGNAMLPSGDFMTRDRAALDGGLRVPPHQAQLVRVYAARGATQRCEELARACEQAANHLERQSRQVAKGIRVAEGTVFIGHGSSNLWRDLKDFVQDRLGLPWDEFNRVPIAGQTNIQRLAEMLDEAAIGFLILTAEDEQADGRMNARQNVIHEAGLFQGRLGFNRAIIMLEEGCEEFSNIHGLGQIRFPPGDIARAFEEVRRVLEREGLIEGPDNTSAVEAPDRSRVE